MKFRRFVCLFTIVFCLNTPLFARSSFSIPVDRSFHIQPMFKVDGTGSAPKYQALFYVKLVNANGKLAVCGLKYGLNVSGGRVAKFFKRSSVVSGKKRLVYDIRYFTNGFNLSKVRLAEFKSSPRKMIQNAAALSPNYKYVTGIDARCKITKIKWDAQYSKVKPFIKIPEKIFLRAD